MSDSWEAKARQWLWDHPPLAVIRGQDSFSVRHLDSAEETLVKLLADAYAEGWEDGVGCCSRCQAKFGTVQQGRLCNECKTIITPAD